MAHPSRIHLPVASLLASSLLAASLAAQAEPSNKWRLEVDGDAASAGVIVLEVRPVGATPTRVDVPVANGVGENDIAQSIASALQARLNTESVTVEVDDGEDVLVKRPEGAADFELAVVSSNVGGVELEVDRE
jgi:hypothetical protein